MLMPLAEMSKMDPKQLVGILIGTGILVLIGMAIGLYLLIKLKKKRDE